MSEAPLLAVRDATRRFGAITALENVSLDVAGGEVVAVLDESAAAPAKPRRCRRRMFDCSAPSWPALCRPPVRADARRLPTARATANLLWPAFMDGRHRAGHDVQKSRR